MKTKDLTMIALLVAFISVSAQLAIPLGPVPFTLQTTLILMTGLILGAKKGALAVLIYILVGAIGLPVFSGGRGGVAVILAQTGGFIISFPIMAFVAGAFSEVSNKVYIKYIGCVIGVLLNFAVGCLYFMFITEMSLYMSLTYTVFPFVITTIVQIIIAVTLSFKIKNAIG